MLSTRIHIGDDEVLLDDSLQYVERAVAAGVDAQADVWMAATSVSRKIEGGSTGAGCHRCFPRRQATGARESVKLPIEIIGG